MFKDLKKGDRVYILRTDDEDHSNPRETKVWYTTPEGEVHLEDDSVLPLIVGDGNVYEDEKSLLCYLIPDKAKGSRWCTKWSGNIGTSTKLYCAEVGVNEGVVYLDFDKYTAKIRDVITSLDNNYRIIVIDLKNLYTDEDYTFTIAPGNHKLRESTIRCHMDEDDSVVVVGLTMEGVYCGAYPTLQNSLNKKLEEMENLEKEINKLQYSLSLFKETGKYHD